jgi:hypothetical protein
MVKHTGLLYMHFWEIQEDGKKKYIYDLDLEIDEVLRPMIEDWVWEYINLCKDKLVDVGFNVDPYNGSVIDYCIETTNDCSNPLTGFNLKETVDIVSSKIFVSIGESL